MIYILVFIFIFIILLIIFIVLLYIFPGFFIDKKNAKCKEPDIIASYNFLNDHELNKIKSKIKDISKDTVTSRNSVMSTIGTPLYVEGSNNKMYQRNKEKYNQILSSNFDWLYSKLLDKLEYITEEKCVYSNELSLPGFHLFKAGSWLGSGWSVASLHVDKQYEYIQDNQYLDTNDVFSFTVGIDLPNKSGLYIYDCTDNDIHPGLWPFHTYFTDHKLYKVYYDIGKIYIHDGLHYHMISAFYSNNNDRITLQGHGIWNKKLKQYIIYW